MNKIHLRSSLLTLLYLLCTSIFTFAHSGLKSYDIASENGVWLQDGYGRIIEITDKSVSVYDICQVSCIPTMEIPREMLHMFGEITHVTETELTVEGGINVYQFKRLLSLPDLCSEKLNKKKRNDPMYNFESLWHSFNEHYCAFEKRGIDWEAYKNNYQSRITSNMSDLKFYLVLKEMLESMDDGHVWIALPDKLEKKYEEKMLHTKKPEQPKNQTPISDLKRDVRWKLRDVYTPNYKQYHKGLLRWGMTSDKVAYLQINAMEYFAHYSLDETLENNAYFQQYGELQENSIHPFKELVAGLEMIMDSVLRDMQGAEAYILDIRFNGGGTDEVSLEIMNRFAKERTKVFTKKARLGNGYTKVNEVFVDPSETTFTSGPVFVLTSAQTASAAEIMTMCAYAMPNVTIVGGDTEGIFSDILDKQLPNGWSYSISNEVYQTIDGSNWEGKGIPPNIDLKYPRDTREFFQLLYDNIKDGKDEAIEQCLKMIEGKR